MRELKKIIKRRKKVVANDYIPTGDQNFDQFFKNITQYAAERCTGSTPEWTHIPASDRTALNNVYIGWYSAYVVTLKPHTKQERDEKNKLRTGAKKALRHFVNSFLRYEPVTDLDRANMGIPNRDTIRTPDLEVDKKVEYRAAAGHLREVELKLRVLGSKNRAKPKGYLGALVVYAILDNRPENVDDLIRHCALATKSKYTLQFEESDRGKIVYIALAWFNRRGIKGPWSDIQAVIIP